MAALVLGLASAGVFAMGISLTPSSSQIRVGDHFNLLVGVNDARDGVYSADEVIAFGFDVAIGNPLLVSWTGAEVAMPPFSDDLSADLIDTGVAGLVGAGPGITDPAFTLAVLHFVATGEGVLDLGIFSNLGDLNEGLIYVTEAARDLTAATQVTIQGAGQAPLPGTLVLLIGGLPWLVRRVRGR
ncbi:hypothetical protein THSYN_19340 [Candidatus Thiodictyon syntrophicum]|uniref:Cohesin domain-containing protein n=2 Tax=Candidatus Thiodictyon syntrophicum TaxID=1166950 RepID=A0A2K8UBD3_9GAMM|nr:hypothetical protein THSYN_19340 [Candidatus Thiodictyon syntrophicum]